jgi:hypothetical protein
MNSLHHRNLLNKSRAGSVRSVRLLLELQEPDDTAAQPVLFE